MVVNSNKESLVNLTASSALLIFVASLPFNGVEWNWIGVERFELKITMITFPILLLVWIMKEVILAGKRQRSTKERVFCLLALVYASSQFLSLINSPYPVESLKQAVIVVCLLIMMLVVSETLSSRKDILYTLSVMGILALMIATAGVITYYFSEGDFSARLGRSGTKFMGIIALGGDPYYYGDILLCSIGPVLFLTLKYSQKGPEKLIAAALLFLLFSAITLTYTKGLLIAVSVFFLISLFYLKGERALIVSCFIIFVVAVSVNIQLNGFLQLKTLEAKHTVLREAKKTEITNPVKHGFNLFMREKLSAGELNVFGSNSLYYRLKLIEVSIKEGIDNFWFGHGAGLSEKLLPRMMYLDEMRILNDGRILSDDVDLEKSDADINYSLLDSHILFITEFFNVGIVGALSLTLLVLFVLREMLHIVKISVRDMDPVPSLLFATLSAMLIFRFFGSLIVIPFLWFMLGLCFGACKMYWAQKDTGRQ